VSDGVVIDVTAMSSVHADPSTRQATIGSGATLMQVADGLAPDGLVVPGGTCATVGIAGLALGGGQGVTGRRFGLTCDSMLGATVVLADGSVVRCDVNRHPDLFWGLRGGGGGRAGVACSRSRASAHEPHDLLALWPTKAPPVAPGPRGPRRHHATWSSPAPGSRPACRCR
jgi:FAD/FMN-containing dehydrogenase